MSRTPTLDDLRRQAELQGVPATDADLEGVLGFLTVLLPELEAIEETIPFDTAPAGMFLP